MVVGGALYAFRWHRDARRFVKRHTRSLRRVPTYMFSSGPLDDSAGRRDIAPVKGVAALMSAGRCPRPHDLRGTAVARRERVPGQRNGQEERRGLARSGPGASLDPPTGVGVAWRGGPECLRPLHQG